MTKFDAGTGEFISGTALEVWDAKWESLPGGFSVAHRQLRGMAGLYRAVAHGEVVVIGKGSGGQANRLYKRLADLRRPGDSGRNYPAGHFIHENIDWLELQVLVLGGDREACQTADSLLRPMLILHRPRENVPIAIVDEAVRRSYRGLKS
jgi:hypothetical protein